MFFFFYFYVASFYCLNSILWFKNFEIKFYIVIKAYEMFFKMLGDHIENRKPKVTKALMFKRAFCRP